MVTGVPAGGHGERGQGRGRQGTGPRRGPTNKRRWNGERRVVGRCECVGGKGPGQEGKRPKRAGAAPRRGGSASVGWRHGWAERAVRGARCRTQQRQRLTRYEGHTGALQRHLGAVLVQPECGAREQAAAAEGRPQRARVVARHRRRGQHARGSADGAAGGLRAVRPRVALVLPRQARLAAGHGVGLQVVGRRHELPTHQQGAVDDRTLCMREREFDRGMRSRGQGAGGHRGRTARAGPERGVCAQAGEGSTRWLCRGWKQRLKTVSFWPGQPLHSCVCLHAGGHPTAPPLTLIHQRFYDRARLRYVHGGIRRWGRRGQRRRLATAGCHRWRSSAQCTAAATQPG
jgi:hypothetical protein